MNFEKESPPSSSLSSTSSPCQLSPCTPVTPPNPYPSDSSQPQLSSSHKRKAGRKKFRETRHPVYRGVRRRNGNKWVSEIREPNKKSRIWLGTYPTPEMAARAHDVAVLALRGTSAVFNFPNSALLLPVSRSCSTTDIRAAAAKVAEAFKPNTSSYLLSASSTSSNTFCGETRCENMDTADPCLAEENSCLKISMHSDYVEGTHHDLVTNINYDESKTTFLDEEALYNMPGLLDSMAEGLLITPPSMKRAMDWDDIACETDLPLWTD